MRCKGARWGRYRGARGRGRYRLRRATQNMARRGGWRRAGGRYARYATRQMGERGQTRQRKRTGGPPRLRRHALRKTPGGCSICNGGVRKHRGALRATGLFIGSDRSERIGAQWAGWSKTALVRGAWAWVHGEKQSVLSARKLWGAAGHVPRLHIYGRRVQGYTRQQSPPGGRGGCRE